MPQEDDKKLESVCTDKKCQPTKCYKKIDKNCQITNMQPVKPQMDVQLKKPAKLKSSYKKKDELKYVYKNKNCQDTICECDDFESQSTVRLCSDMNCQKITKMWTVMPEIMNMQSSKPAIRRVCNDKNCQSKRCYKKKIPVRPMYDYDKNCQSANMM